LKKYIVANIKAWHKKTFQLKQYSDFKDWILIESPDELSIERLSEIQPRYIFFPHWSWIVPDEIINNFECVCFHSSDVPFGRGGSPIQNLIIRGLTETKISALRMVKELDAGPVYLKKDLSLMGCAQDIYEHSAIIISDMMREIAQKEISPQQQTGKAVCFKRRTGNDNILPAEGNLAHLYNHIRMLDADSYPSSFIDHGEFRIEFSKASLKEDMLEAVVRIKKKI
jgi:methionyl-tRNA formyltransferase